MTFISFSCMILWLGLPIPWWIKSGVSGHHCFLPDLSRKAFSFSPLSMMLPVFLSYVAFIMLRCIPFIFTLLRVFYHKQMWIFKMLFLNLLRWLYNFYPHFVNVIYHIDWFADIEPSLYPWNESHLIVVCNSCCFCFSFFWCIILFFF